MSFETVKIKKKSGTQIIQIPEGLRIEDDKVYLKKSGNSIYGFFSQPWELLINSTEMFTKDFLNKRDQPEVQDRDLYRKNHYFCLNFDI